MADAYSGSFEDFIKQADMLGLDGEKKEAYVQKCFERLDRQREREEQKRRDDMAVEDRQREREEQKRRDDMAIEMEKEKAKQAVEIEKERTKQLEIESHMSTRSKNSAESREFQSAGPRPVFPKLPMFREKHDDIDSFLFRFESHATSLKWDRTQWVVYLSALLEGNALSLYHSLSSNTDGLVSYENLKENLLKKFQCTADGFRKRFRESRPDQNETFQTYGIELTRLLDRWIALSNTEKTVKGLMNLILGEQFLESVSNELATFIREKDLTSFDDMIKQAEAFRLARPGKNLARKSPSTIFAAAAESRDEQSLSSGSFRSSFRGRRQGFRNRVPYRGQQRGGGRGRGSNSSIPLADRTCDLCGEKGHATATCPLKSSPNPCFICGIGGHRARECPLKKVQKANAVLGEPEVLCSVLQSAVGRLQLEAGYVNQQSCSVLRDTGATICGVRKRLVHLDQYTGEDVRCVLFDGGVKVFPVAKVVVQSPYFLGELACCVLEDPVADLIIGNLPGLSKVDDDMVVGSSIPSTGAVTTRAQTKAANIPHKPLVQVSDDLKVSKEELSKLQRNDSSLKACFTLAESGERKAVGSAFYSFYVKGGVLYRQYEKGQAVVEQIVVPTELRSSVLVVSHDQILAGHCGVRRTLARILTKFFWPGVTTDVSRYCHTCDICQKTVSKGRVPPVPLVTMPLIGMPFEKVAIDLVGPLAPPSEQGHRYILTLVDLATRFPEAVPLKDISSVSVAEALLSIFARLGFPKVILSDCGAQFLSELMKQFHALCGTQAIHTAPYHPQANGTVERFHGTLKTMLRKVVHSQPKSWHRYLPALLFACRELPSESTGFSPFELMFGRLPRGPIALLADSWTQDQVTDDAEQKHVYHYLFELKNIISESCEIARQNSASASRKGKRQFDRKAKFRSFAVNDEVLVLLPSDNNKLLMTWSGPYRVQECLHPDYRILIKSKSKIFHANMLKRYLRREDTAAVSISIPDDGLDKSTTLSVGDHIPWEEITEFLLPSTSVVEVDFVQTSAGSGSVGPEIAFVGVIQDDDVNSVPTLPLPMSSSMSEEDISSIDFCQDLSQSESTALRGVFQEFADILKTKPGSFSGDVYLDIELTSSVPVRRRPYDLPFSSKLVVEREIQTMLDLGVIEKSRSAYSSPVVLVRKPDGSCRFCIDYRALNKITVFDAEPIPDVEEMFTQLSRSVFFTRIDLSKGYWQIFVNPLDRHKTAFATHLGLYQWVRMPFGLVAAPAVFARMMRTLQLHQLSSVNFFDDILVHSGSFADHLGHVRAVLQRLQQSQLTARPSKISSGYKTLEFLGHVIGQGLIRPEVKKVQKILAIPTPTTKKQVRSLLGLLSFYRRYVPNFASLTAPISDLTKEGQSRSIAWTPACEDALNSIKAVFSTSPVLQLPRLDEPFVLQTDASSTGLGAVLLQYFDGTLHPVCFASRKLLDRETRYSTIERECLAIVWSVTKFSKFLWGVQFTLQTDHRPLVYLQTCRFKNSRIMRWALSLQEFRFHVEPLPGTKNVFADMLSRAQCDQAVP